MRNKTDQTVAEARKLATDVLYSEKGHFATASRWRYWQFWMGITSAILAAAAGASFLATIFPASIQEWLPPLLAFMASLITTLSVILKPDQIWEKHHAAGVDYGILRRKIRQFVQIECSNPVAEDELAVKLRDLTDQVGEVQKRARPIPSYAHAAAYKSINAGHADYEERELDAATGAVE